MAKFNAKTSRTPNAISYEGGSVYEKSPVEEWMNFLFSSYIEDRFYENSSKQLERFHKLTKEMLNCYGAEFVAKAAMFARNELGMRSAAQYVASLMNGEIFADKRIFFRNFCHRPDDVSEIFSVLDDLGDKRSHALVRGCGDYLSSLSSYTLGKYKLTNHAYNMYDLINITHVHSDVIDAYKAGTLETPDTWETAISGAQDKTERDYEWIRLVEDRRLGYLALIRNLRNILNTDTGIDDAWVVKCLCPQLEDTQAIRKSMVYPYQIYSAYKNMGIRNPYVVASLDFAFKAAINNMPVLSGNTAIILDVSGSMCSPISAKSNITICEAGAVYAACVALKAEHCQIIKFATYAQEFKFNRVNLVFNEIAKMTKEDGCGWGTNLAPAYHLLDKHYDRIMLISDMQIMDNPASRFGWESERDAMSAYKDYCREYGITKLYSFDLGNYHTQTDNPNNPNIYLCTSLSEKTLKFINLLENGKSLVDYINDNYDYR